MSEINFLKSEWRKMIFFPLSQFNTKWKGDMRTSINSVLISLPIIIRCHHGQDAVMCWGYNMNKVGMPGAHRPVENYK